MRNGNQAPLLLSIIVWPVNATEFLLTPTTNKTPKRRELLTIVAGSLLKGIDMRRATITT